MPEVVGAGIFAQAVWLQERCANHSTALPSSSLHLRASFKVATSKSRVGRPLEGLELDGSEFESQLRHSLSIVLASSVNGDVNTHLTGLR